MKENKSEKIAELNINTINYIRMKLAIVMGNMHDEIEGKTNDLKMEDNEKRVVIATIASVIDMLDDVETEMKKPLKVLRTVLEYRELVDAHMGDDDESPVHEGMN